MGVGEGREVGSRNKTGIGIGVGIVISVIKAFDYYVAPEFQHFRDR
jgi:hypothetical protein